VERLKKSNSYRKRYRKKKKKYKAVLLVLT
jgi:hypothetical protein